MYCEILCLFHARLFYVITFPSKETHHRQHSFMKYIESSLLWKTFNSQSGSLRVGLFALMQVRGSAKLEGLLDYLVILSVYHPRGSCCMHEFLNLHEHYLRIRQP